MVWWFGGTESETSQDEDQCELVAVRIERTSSNSRRIAGEISVPTPVRDVWAILTDYDHLAVHVPNLMESRRLSSSKQNSCRLFQRGAQKIVGFEFGASVTMDMMERAQRCIEFKCVESPFFQVFDGAWTVDAARVEDPVTGQVVDGSSLAYVVDVRPRGPVPVAALEWRIREDVPTNLRAVKRAAIEVGWEGVQQRRAMEAARNAQFAVNVKWEKDETMAAYLDLGQKGAA